MLLLRDKLDRATHLMINTAKKLTKSIFEYNLDSKRFFL